MSRRGGVQRASSRRKSFSQLLQHRADDQLRWRENVGLRIRVLWTEVDLVVVVADRNP
jgi:hypothetical protein